MAITKTTFLQMLPKIQAGSLSDLEKALRALGDGDFNYVGGTAIAATAAEIDRVADVSARIVDVTASTLAVAAASHEGKTVTLTRAAGITVTLPAATGSGARYRFVLGAAVTSNSTIIKVTGDDVMYGNVLTNSTGDTPDLAQPWPTAADSDTITLNGTTTGGAAIGDFVELEDIAADKWAVWGGTTSSGYS